MISNVSGIASDPKFDADPPPYGVKLAHDDVIAAAEPLTSE